MPAPQVRGDYEALSTIAKTFAKEAQDMSQVLQRLKGAVDTLRNGDWVGTGATAFYAEMDGAIFPAQQRLMQALNQAAQVVNNISQVIKTAEDDSARLFQVGLMAGAAALGGGEAGGGTGGGSGGGNNASGPMAEAGPEIGPAPSPSSGGTPGATGTGTGTTSAGTTAGTTGTGTASAAANAPKDPASITPEQLSKIMPNLTPAQAKEYAQYFSKTMKEFNINTPQRQAMFLAQVAHESGQMKFMKENLNYSAKGLLATFPKYFNATTAAEYARQPEKIASHVYANRMGNGTEASGDGWKYRGRGAIQLTGKNNYAAAGKDLGLDLVGNPDLASSPETGIRLAGWFWNKNNLNTLADEGKFKAVTKRINGGYNGLADRLAYHEKAWNALK